LILMGLLPAQMLRQGVTKGRPIRILVWVFAIVSQATPCVLFGLRPEIPEIFFPCLAFTLATVVSLVLVSTELAFKRDEFLKNRADDRKEARWRLWRNYVYSTTAEPEAIVIEEVIVSSSKTNDDDEANLRCPKCGTNAGCEAYYNNCDNICYMTYCTKCVHEHGLYVLLEKISEKEKVQNLKEEASKTKEKDFVKIPMDEHVGSCAKELNPVSRVLQARSHYEVLGVEISSTEDEIRVAFRQLALAVHPDKNNDPRAGQAFARVQQAFSGLSKET